MDHQRSGSSYLRSRQQQSAPPPLYLSSDDIMTDLDVELEQEELQPPRYLTMFDAVPHLPPRQLLATSRSLANAPVAHEFYIKGGGKASKPWAMLRLSSQAASAEKAPRFRGGDVVSGFVDIMLENSGAQSVQAVTLTLRGKLTASLLGNYAEHHTFLDKQMTVWSKSPSSSSAPPSARKLEGNYSWPFSFLFPTQTDVPIRGRPSMQPYPTPQTFLERGKNISVHYELVLKVTHGFLKPDSKLPINVIYVPEITPPPMSEIRQVAYRDGINVPGSDMDPESWHILPSTLVRGHVLNRPVEIRCVLSLAKPLTYTRDTFIPVHFILGSTDSQALDILASPKAIQLRLRQTLKYFQDSKKAAGGLEESDIVAEAQWWVPQDPTAQTPEKRTICGELHLPRDMQPSCSFLLLNVEYMVEFIPFFSPVFQPDEAPDIPVASCPVKLGTFHAAGPLPKAVTTPLPRRVTASTIREQEGDLSGTWLRPN